MRVVGGGGQAPTPKPVARSSAASGSSNSKPVARAPAPKSTASSHAARSTSTTTRRTTTTTARSTFRQTVTEKKVGTFNERDTKAKVSAKKASIEHERTTFRGTEKTRSREVARGGAARVKDVEKDVKGKTLYSFDLLAKTDFGKKLTKKVDEFNASWNVDLARLKKKVIARGRYGTVSHQGHIETGTRIDKPTAKLNLTTRGADVRLGAGAHIGVRGEYEVSYASRTRSVGGVKYRNDTKAKVEASVGASAAGDARLTIAPRRGKMVAGAGGEVFAGAKVGVSGETGLSRMRKGKPVTLAKAGGSAEGWAGAGLSGDAKFALDGWKISYKLEGGAALGLGGKLGASGEVNPKEIAVAAKDMSAKKMKPVVREVKASVKDGTIKRDLAGTAKQMAKNPKESVKDAWKFWSGGW